MTVTKLVGSIIVLVALIGATPVFAQDAGKVLFVKGDVALVSHDGVRREARRGMVIRDGERMVTGPGAMGQVKLTDGVRVGLRSSTGVTFEPKRASQPRTLALNSGNVRVLTPVRLKGGQGDASSPVPSVGGGTERRVVLKTPGGNLEMARSDAVAAIQAQGAKTFIRVNEGEATARNAKGAFMQLGREQVASLGAASIERLDRSAFAPAIARVGSTKSKVSKQLAMKRSRGKKGGSVTPGLNTRNFAGKLKIAGTRLVKLPSALPKNFRPKGPTKPVIPAILKSTMGGGAPLKGLSGRGSIEQAKTAFNGFNNGGLIKRIVSTKTGAPSTNNIPKVGTIEQFEKSRNRSKFRIKP
jgi:hypothetical protein